MGSNKDFIPRLQAEPCMTFPRLNRIRIRQPNAPNNAFIIPLFIINTSKLSYELLNCKITWFDPTKYVESKHKNKQKQHVQVHLCCAENPRVWLRVRGKTRGNTRASTLNMFSLPDIMRLKALKVGYEIYPVAGILQWSFPNMVVGCMIK